MLVRNVATGDFDWEDRIVDFSLGDLPADPLEGGYDGSQDSAACGRGRLRLVVLECRYCDLLFNPTRLSLHHD